MIQHIFGRTLWATVVLISGLSACGVADDSRPMDAEGTPTGQISQAVVLPPSCSIYSITEFESSCAATLWAGGRIPYQFVGSWLYADAQAVTDYMTNWETATAGTIDFVPRNGEAQYIEINQNGFCKADFGAGSPNMVQLGGCGGFVVAQRPITHEFGHAIGLKHQHKRYDRDRYVLVRPDVYCNSGGTLPQNHCGVATCSPTTPCCGYTSVLSLVTQVAGDTLIRCPASDPAEYGPFDFASTMLYASGVPQNVCPATPATCGLVNLNGTVLNPAWASPFISQGDASAVIEKYAGGGIWTPFRRIYRSDPGPTQPLDMNLAAGVSVQGAPAVSRWGTDGVAVVARGANNHYYVKYNASGGVTWPTGDWQDLGGDFASEPAAASWAVGRLDFVGIGIDGKVWHRDVNNYVLEGPHDLGLPPGTGAASAAGVSTWGVDRLDIFVRRNTHIWQKTWSGSWSGWSDRGGDFKSKPAAVSWGVNRIDIVGVGVDDKVWHKAYHGGTNWDAWYESLGGSGVVLNGTGPAIASKGVDHLAVYVSGSESFIWYKTYGPTWGNWTALGGVSNDSPSAIATTTNHAHVAAHLKAWNGVSAGIWHKKF